MMYSGRNQVDNGHYHLHQLILRQRTSRIANMRKEVLPAIQDAH